MKRHLGVVGFLAAATIIFVTKVKMFSPTNSTSQVSPSMGARLLRVALALVIVAVMYSIESRDKNGNLRKALRRGAVVGVGGMTITVLGPPLNFFLIGEGIFWGLGLILAYLTVFLTVKNSWSAK